jgi:hypothetical protein
MSQDLSATQAELYPLEDWLGVLDACGVRFLVLDLRSDRDVVNLFRSQSGWRVDFEDGEAVLFARADTA